MRRWSVGPMKRWTAAFLMAIFTPVAYLVLLSGVSSRAQKRFERVLR